MTSHTLANTALQVMLAQQESIAQLVTVYEEVRSSGTGNPRAAAAASPGQCLDATQQEDRQGKARMQGDRYATAVSQEQS